MEHDPTLASCCQREIKDRRIKQGKLDAIRAGMPAALVDKSLIRTVDAGKPAHADVRAEYGAMTEEEIDAALNDDELDLELEQLRLSRLQQLRCRLCWRSARYAVCDRCHLLSSSCVCRQWGGCLPCGLFAAYHPLLLATGRVPRPPNAPARTIKTRAQGSSEAFLPPCLLSCSWTSPFQGSPSWHS
eukprot:Tamp_08563.p2 GENE.Tamp_08563~~Tamp_08563.p2  ORF type:complete len:198 (+),score=26.50 Tamp_08563:36-596(+)